MGTLEELIGMACGDSGDVNVTFIVEDTAELNNSVVHLSPVTMENLNIWYGVAILLQGNNNRKAVCTVHTDENENCGSEKIRMNEVVRNKLGVLLGGSVSLRSFHEIPKGKKIVVRPIRDGCEFLQTNLFESYLRPYFFGANRPVNNGDVFSVKGLSRTVEFKVIKTIPSQFCIVGPSTIINCEELKAANKRREEEPPGVSKKVKGPQICIQSSGRPQVQNADTLPVQNGNELPVQNADALPKINADKQPLQNGETSSAHKNENPNINVGQVIKASEANEPTTLEDKIKFAYSLKNQGELKKAKHAFVDVINTQNKNRGPSHQDLLPFKETLATILFDLRRYNKLAQLLKDPQLRDTRSRALLDIKFLIAMFLTANNKSADAAAILFGASEHIRSMEQSFIEKWKVQVLCASVLYCHNKLEQALKYLGDNTLGGPRFLDKATFLNVLKRLNNLKDLNLHSSDPKYANTLIIKYHIGWFYYKLRDYTLATETLQEILPSMTETMGSDHLCSKLTDDILEVCKEQMLHARE